nr:hypothetical protein [Tanacetum cinerariifolium]
MTNLDAQDSGPLRKLAIEHEKDRSMNLRLGRITWQIKLKFWFAMCFKSVLEHLAFWTKEEEGGVELGRVRLVKPREQICSNALSTMVSIGGDSGELGLGVFGIRFIV